MVNHVMKIELDGELVDVLIDFVDGGGLWKVNYEIMKKITPQLDAVEHKVYHEFGPSTVGPTLRYMELDGEVVYDRKEKIDIVPKYALRCMGLTRCYGGFNSYSIDELYNFCIESLFKWWPKVEWEPFDGTFAKGRGIVVEMKRRKDDDDV